MTKNQKWLMGALVAFLLFLMIKPYLGSDEVEYSSQDSAARSEPSAPPDMTSSGSTDDTAADLASTTEAMTEAAALARIQSAGHACNEVIQVEPLGDSAAATCSDGERYRLADVVANGEVTPVAMKCSAVEELGIAGC